MVKATLRRESEGFGMTLGNVGPVQVVQVAKGIAASIFYFHSELERSDFFFYTLHFFVMAGVVVRHCSSCI